MLKPYFSWEKVGRVIGSSECSQALDDDLGEEEWTNFDAAMETPRFPFTWTEDSCMLLRTSGRVGATNTRLGSSQILEFYAYQIRRTTDFEV